MDDGRYSGSGNAPRASSRKVAPKVGEVVLYADSDKDGFFDQISFDYDGDKTVDLLVDLNAYRLPKPELIKPADVKWEGLHDQFKRMAKQSWNDAQRLYRAAWRAGLTNAELEELAIAASTWEKYDHGYWLKEMLFRRLDRQWNGEREKQAALRHAYFTRDFETMCQLMSEK